MIIRINIKTIETDTNDMWDLIGLTRPDSEANGLATWEVEDEEEAEEIKEILEEYDLLA